MTTIDTKVTSLLACNKKRHVYWALRKIYMFNGNRTTSNWVVRKTPTSTNSLLLMLTKDI